MQHPKSTRSYFLYFWFFSGVFSGSFSSKRHDVGMMFPVVHRLKSVAASLGEIPCRDSSLRSMLRNAFFGALVAIFPFGTLTSSTIQRETSDAQPFRVKGSFVIAAICRDGIIVASDSRGMLKDRQGRRIAYYDTNQKIFPLGDKLIADTGYASLNDPKISFLSALMLQFAESPAARSDVEKLPSSYFQFAAAVLPAAGANSAKFQTLVFAGFNGDKPQLCLYEGQSTQSVSCTFSGYISSPKQRISALQNVVSLSFAQAAQVMRKTIQDYASAVQPGLVGGPVVLRMITRKESDWLGDHPEWPHWNSFSDLDQDYQAGHVTFHLMPGVGKEELDKLIGEGAAWARVGRLASGDTTAGRGPVIDSSHAAQ